MWNLLVFALVGLLAGAAARVFYTARQPMQIPGTMLVGIPGALGGGVLSRAFWPAVEGQFAYGNLLLSLLGAVLGIVSRAGMGYSQRRRV
jgi:uncharacterized membrane protein YeaQ/YmgE (transglycosylase-associated protein family)